MKRITQTAAAAALAMTMAGPSLAADLPRPAFKAPVFTAPLFSWTGLYLGINAGYGFGESDWTGASGAASPKPEGFLAGGTVGYNLQTGHWVWGIEADIAYSDMNERAVGTGICAAPGCETKNSWFGTARGRIGYAWDRWLPYITGGAAFGDIEATTAAGRSEDEVQVGWTVGLGIEYAFMGSWSAKLEYLYADLGNLDCSAATCTTPTEVDFKANIIRAGINYRF